MNLQQENRLKEEINDFSRLNLRYGWCSFKFWCKQSLKLGHTDIALGSSIVISIRKESTEITLQSQMTRGESVKPILK